MTIRKVGVLGAGLMGSGIAEVCAKAGYDTVVREVSRRAGRRRGSRGSRARSRKAVEKGKLPAADRDAAWKRIASTTTLEDLADCDLLVEAIVENLERQEGDLRGRSTRLCKPETIFCSNTSSLTITEMSAATKRPDRFAGLHFFNPVPVMKLVEVVRTIATSDATARGGLRLRAVARQGADPHARQLGLHRQPAARAVPAGRGAGPRGGRRYARGHRQGHGARLRAPDGAAQAARLRRASTRPTRSPRSCSTSTARSASRRRRS